MLTAQYLCKGTMRRLPHYCCATSCDMCDDKCHRYKLTAQTCHVLWGSKAWRQALENAMKPSLDYRSDQGVSQRMLQCLPAGTVYTEQNDNTKVQHVLIWWDVWRHMACNVQNFNWSSHVPSQSFLSDALHSRNPQSYQQGPHNQVVQE